MECSTALHTRESARKRQYGGHPRDRSGHLRPGRGVHTARVHSRAHRTCPTRQHLQVDPIAFGILYVFAAGAVSVGFSQLGLQHVGITLVVRALVGLSTANLVWSIASGVALARRVSAAIEHLPGPKQSHLGVVELFARRPDLHRALTELADDYGPIFRMRALMFRVRCCSLCTFENSASALADVFSAAPVCGRDRSCPCQLLPPTPCRGQVWLCLQLPAEGSSQFEIILCHVLLLHSCCTLTVLSREKWLLRLWVILCWLQSMHG